MKFIFSTFSSTLGVIVCIILAGYILSGVEVDNIPLLFSMFMLSSLLAINAGMLSDGESKK